jgi:hypothetical protein
MLKFMDAAVLLWKTITACGNRYIIFKAAKIVIVNYIGVVTIVAVKQTGKCLCTDDANAGKVPV